MKKSLTERSILNCIYIPISGDHIICNPFCGQRFFDKNHLFLQNEINPIDPFGYPTEVSYILNINNYAWGL